MDLLYFFFKIFWDVEFDVGCIDIRKFDINCIDKMWEILVLKIQ